MDHSGALPPMVWGRAIEEISHVPVASCGTAVVVTLLAALGFGYRLLAEWQRRTTLDRVLTRAPFGSLIMQQKGAGPAMWIWVGESARPVDAERVDRVVVVLPMPTTPVPVQPGGPATHDA